MIYAFTIIGIILTAPAFAYATNYEQGSLTYIEVLALFFVGLVLLMHGLLVVGPGRLFSKNEIKAIDYIYYSFSLIALLAFIIRSETELAEYHKVKVFDLSVSSEKKLEEIGRAYRENYYIAVDICEKGKVTPGISGKIVRYPNYRGSEKKPDYTKDIITNRFCEVIEFLGEHESGVSSVGEWRDSVFINNIDAVRVLIYPPPLSPTDASLALRSNSVGNYMSLLFRDFYHEWRDYVRIKEQGYDNLKSLELTNSLKSHLIYWPFLLCFAIAIRVTKTSAELFMTE